MFNNTFAEVAFACALFGIEKYDQFCNAMDSSFRGTNPIFLFDSFSPFWHLWTSENNEIIFTDEEAFRAGMDIMGICARICPSVRVVTFELMSNHIHITFSGPECHIITFFKLFRDILFRYLKKKGTDLNQKAFVENHRQITTLEDLRNVIAYNNRNGFLVDKSETPFTYPWGANSYYFNRHAWARFLECSSPMAYTHRHKLTRSSVAEKISEPLMMLDGCVCPLSFCDIDLWSRLFFDAHQYLAKIAKNVELQKAIAEEIEEQVYYTDDELFSAVCRISDEKYGITSPKLLPKNAKIELAKTMRNGYNASGKQIQRMLQLDAAVVGALFPTK